MPSTTHDHTCRCGHETGLTLKQDRRNDIATPKNSMYAEHSAAIQHEESPCPVCRRNGLPLTFEEAGYCDYPSFLSFEDNSDDRIRWLTQHREDDEPRRYPDRRPQTVCRSGGPYNRRARVVDGTLFEARGRASGIIDRAQLASVLASGQTAIQDTLHQTSGADAVGGTIDGPRWAHPSTYMTTHDRILDEAWGNVPVLLNQARASPSRAATPADDARFQEADAYFQLQVQRSRRRRSQIKRQLSSNYIGDIAAVSPRVAGFMPATIFAPRTQVPQAGGFLGLPGCTALPSPVPSTPLMRRLLAADCQVLREKTWKWVKRAGRAIKGRLRRVKVRFLRKRKDR